MDIRWRILAALTLARTAMGLQFQSVPAVGSMLSADLGLSYAALGTVIGLYLLPGAAVALPGGWLGQRFGDKRIVLTGLALMAIGGGLVGVSDHHGVVMAGRVISGCGAVLLNVLVTKMVADWFAGREIVTAMGILIVSWPLGIALAMVLLPPLAAVGGWPLTMWAGAAVAAVCFVLLATIYRAPSDRVAARTGAPHPPLTRHEWGLAVLAGLVWMFYNVGFIIVIAFAPDYLTARGQTAVAATALVSFAGWLIIPGLVAGGWIAQRIGRPDATMAVCFAAAVVVIWAIPQFAVSALPFIAVGLLFGPPGPLIMSLPVEAVRPANRSLGMGIYFTCYYLGMAAAPPLAGLARDLSEDPAAPLWFAGATVCLAGLCLALFRMVQRQ